MKISFEGSLDEFKALFTGSVIKGSASVSVPTAIEVPKSNDLSSLVFGGDFQDPMYQPPEEDITKPVDGHALTPEYAHQASTLNFRRDQIAVPAEEKAVGTKLPTIQPEIRKMAWSAFVAFCARWVVGFDTPGAEQPDRLVMMQDLGHGRATIPILIMAYEIKSLQRLVEVALREAGEIKTNDLDWVDKVACNMVQVSHMGFPDLAGTYDYSTSWRRNPPQWSKP